VLVDQAARYGKQMRHYDMLRLALGNGLVTSEGAFWLRQRRIAQPAFHRSRISAFATTMTRVTEERMASWQEALAGGGSIDIAEEMMAVTLRIVCETLLGTHLPGETEAIGRAVTVAIEQINARAISLFALPRFVPSKSNRALNEAVATLDEIVYRVIAERRGQPDQGDLLSMFMLTEDAETGERMNDQQLRDEVLTILTAGHETTANALTWTFYLLSCHPQIEAQLRAQVTARLGERLPTLEDLRELPLLERVIKESMRLYPPVWMMGRSASQDDQIDGMAIDKGSWIFVSPYVTHRHPRFWDNPEGFDPDRFLPEAVQARPRFAYFPFSGGPRQCIGDNFALMEAQLVLATVLRRVRLSLAPWQTVELDPLITLRPKYGMQMLPSGPSPPSAPGGGRVTAAPS
jgi:cytochrome P450